MKIKLISTVLLAVAIFTGCNKDVSDFSKERRLITVTASIPAEISGAASGARTRTSIENAESKIVVKWKTGDTINLFIVQDGKIYEISGVKLNADPGNAKKAEFTFSLPSGTDVNRDFTLYGVHGLTTFSKKDGKILLDRTPRFASFSEPFELPMTFKTDISAPGNQPLKPFGVQFNPVGIMQLFELKNTGTKAFAYLSISNIPEKNFTNLDNYCVFMGKDLNFFTQKFRPPLYDLISGEEAYGENSVGFKPMPEVTIPPGETKYSLFWAVPKPDFIPGKTCSALLKPKAWLPVFSESKERVTPLTVGKTYVIQAEYNGKVLKFR